MSKTRFAQIVRFAQQKTSRHHLVRKVTIMCFSLQSRISVSKRTKIIQYHKKLLPSLVKLAWLKKVQNFIKALHKHALEIP